MRKQCIVIFISLFFLSSCSPRASIFRNGEVSLEDNNSEATPYTANNNNQNRSDPVNTIPSPPALPVIKKSFDQPVPFFSQAPFEVWDELHNEACEEAAMIMAASYFQKERLSRHDMEQKILKLVSWQEDNGFTVDITAQEVKEILWSYFHIHSELSTEVDSENIIRQLERGNLIIAPAAGRLLKNPYYRRPGPLYHMLIIRGYDRERKEFITNDPGTKRGEAYRYPYDQFLSAIHDWPKKGAGRESVSEEEMNQGQKVMIVVEATER